MRWISATIRPFKLHDVRRSLAEYGIHGMTVSDVRGVGWPRSIHDRTLASDDVSDGVARIKVEIAVPYEQVASVVEIIVREANTGHHGDGRLLVLPLSMVVHIRTGERDRYAL